MVNPSNLSSRLRRIAAKIDASEKPSAKLVAHELRSTLAMIDDPGLEPKLPSQLEPYSGILFQGPNGIVIMEPDPDQPGIIEVFHFSDMNAANEFLSEGRDVPSYDEANTEQMSPADADAAAATLQYMFDY